MSKFVLVRYWTWEHFSGKQSICTSVDATEHQVKSWINQSTARGAGGNYKADSLISKVQKVKASRISPTNMTDVSLH